MALQRAIIFVTLSPLQFTTREDVLSPLSLSLLEEKE